MIVGKTLKDIILCGMNSIFVWFYQFAETDYFLDGLLSCGSSACLEVFGDCLKNNRVYDPFTSSLILYDLAFNHEISVEVISTVFVSRLDNIPVITQQYVMYARICKKKKGSKYERDL